MPHGLNPWDDSDADADLDNDGFSNFDEIMQGSDPSDERSVPATLIPWLDILLELE